MSPPDVAVFLEQMKSEDYASGTCNRALVLLRFGFELAIRWKMPGVSSNPVKEIKNIKIDPEVHEILKKYCEKRGLKIYKFLENLILEKCKEKKDIYGED